MIESRVFTDRTRSLAGSARFRAVERRAVVASSQRALALSGFGIAFYSVFGAAFHPHSASLIAPINGLLVGFAIVAYLTIQRRPKWAPNLLFAELIAIVAGTIALGWSDRDFVIGALAILLLIAPALPLIVPWPLRVHVAFIAVHAAAVAIFILASPTMWLPVSERPVLVAVAIGSIIVGMAGHVVNLRDRLERFDQLERIRRLRRVAADQNRELERLNRELERAALTDELTGLPNRLGLSQHLPIVRSAVSRYDRTFGLLILDLDHFKAINDRFGHLVGDDVLRTVGRALGRLIRPDDVAFRFGGEEFLVIGEVGGEDDTIALAERIRTGLAALAIDHPGNPPHGRVTVSIGASTIEPRDLVDDAAVWLARADRALYEAKAAGRDRTVFGERPSDAATAQRMVGVASQR